MIKNGADHLVLLMTESETGSVSDDRWEENPYKHDRATHICICDWLKRERTPARLNSAPASELKWKSEWGQPPGVDNDHLTDECDVL